MTMVRVVRTCCTAVNARLRASLVCSKWSRASTFCNCTITLSSCSWPVGPVDTIYTYMHIYVCMYMYIYVYIYIYTYIDIHTYVNIHFWPPQISVYIHIYLYIYNIHLYIYIHIYIYVYNCVYRYTF
jgi:hypothetical protein